MDPKTLLRKLLSFALISGVGLGIDFILFTMGIGLGASPTLSNLVSASAAVTFVYFVSVRRIFEYRGHFLYAKFLIYCAYQTIMVFLASAAIGALAARFGMPLLMKAATAPVTLLVNFLFMMYLTRVRIPKIQEG
jgi:hypothetical protein